MSDRHTVLLRLRHNKHCVIVARCFSCSDAAMVAPCRDDGQRDECRLTPIRHVQQLLFLMRLAEHAVVASDLWQSKISATVLLRFKNGGVTLLFACLDDKPLSQQ